MDAHQGGFIPLDLAHDHGHVHAAFDTVFVGNQAEVAMHGGQLALTDTADGMFGAQAIVDQVGDGADLYPVQASERLQLGASGHAAVFVHHLDYHRGGAETGQACQIAPGFGVPCAVQYAAIASAQREDMSGLDQILGLGVRRDGGEHGA